MRVIINVDDVGLHPAVLRAAEAGVEAGVVTSISVLPNGPCARDAARLEGVGVGVHLNLLRGAPLLAPAQVSSLVGDNGLFLRSYPRLLRRYVTRRLRLDQVEAEWTRQIEVLREWGLPLTHLDSEEHLHAWPRLMPIACRLAKRHGLNWVRRPVERVQPLRWDGRTLRCRLLNLWGLRHRPRPGVSWPDAVWGVADPGGRLTPQRFRAYLERVPEARVVELFCHPGLPISSDPPFPRTFEPTRVTERWKPELISLTQLPWLPLFEELSLDLTHYGRIEPSGDPC